MTDLWTVRGFGLAQLQAISAAADEIGPATEEPFDYVEVNSAANGWAIEVSIEGYRGEARATALHWGNIARNLVEVRGEQRRVAVSAARRIARELTSPWTLLAAFGMGAEMVIELRDFRGEESCVQCREQARAGAIVCSCGCRFREGPT